MEKQPPERPKIAQRTICMMLQLEEVILDQLNRTSHIDSDYVFPD